MSRTVKTSHQQLFNKLPQKASARGFYDGVDEEVPPSKCLTYTKNSSRSSSHETNQDSDAPQIQLDSSEIQQGVSKKVVELFEEMKSRASDSRNIFRIQKAGSRISTPHLSDKTDQKRFERVSSQTNIKGIKATRELPPTSKEGARKLRWLVSLNPDSVHPQKVLKRFFTLTELDEQVYIIALIYLHRALDWEPELEVRHFHKLLTGCLLLASKYLIEGHFWDYEDFGFLSGVSSGQLEKIEKCILRRILNYTLYISDDEYQGAVRSILMALVF